MHWHDATKQKDEESLYHNFLMFADKFGCLFAIHLPLYFLSPLIVTIYSRQHILERIHYLFMHTSTITILML